MGDVVFGQGYASGEDHACTLADQLLKVRGTSWVMAVDDTGDSVRAWVMLTYGEIGDRASDLFDVQTQRFSDKDWREAAFTEEAIRADPAFSEVTVRAA